MTVLGDAISSPTLIDADTVFRDLAIDTEKQSELKPGANNKRETKNLTGKLTSLFTSPKRLVNGNKVHKTKPASVNVRNAESASSSNDSLEQDRRALSPHRTSSHLPSPQRRNNSKTTSGLIVPSKSKSHAFVTTPGLPLCLIDLEQAKSREQNNVEG